jgi:hypothetical protein
MDQAVSHRNVTEMSWVRSQATAYVRLVAEKVTLGQFPSDFLEVTLLVSLNQRSILIFITSCFYQKDKWTKPENLLKSDALGNRVAFYFFSLQKHNCVLRL